MKSLYLLVLLAPLASLAAQLDYRNLDGGRPLETVDAAPLDHRAWELQLPYTFQSGPSGQALHLVAPSVSAGILSGLEVDAGVTGAATSSGDLALAEAAGGMTAALTTESSLWPAVAVTAGIQIPIDRVAGTGVTGTAGLLATRTFGYTRLHLNGGIGIGRQDHSGPLRAAPRWYAAAAIDRTLFRQSVLVAVELRTGRLLPGAATDLSAGTGFRWQWSPVLVLDAGASFRLNHSDEPAVSLTIGLSREFSWAGHRPVGAP